MARKADLPTGYVVYDGPSLLDGGPIIAVVTGIHDESKNGKTGDLPQMHIVVRDTHPITASRLGLDASVCGACPHMGTPDPSKGSGWARERTCYVRLNTAPTSVWHTFHKGRYPSISPLELAKLVADKGLRLGAYGDPAAVPAEVWAPAADAAKASGKAVNGYTHQWQNPAFQHLRPWLMASADTEEEQISAVNQGWRVFRVRTAAEPLLPREVMCPASAEYEVRAGRRTSCAECKMCGGADSRFDRSVAIVAHGNGAGHIARRGPQTVFRHTTGLDTSS
jgi:hypothetical protein